jgi:hypothetical protein
MVNRILSQRGNILSSLPILNPTYLMIVFIKITGKRQQLRGQMDFISDTTNRFPSPSAEPNLSITQGSLE